MFLAKSSKVSGEVVNYRHGHTEKDYLSVTTPSTFLKGAIPHRGKQK